MSIVIYTEARTGSTEEPLDSSLDPLTLIFSLYGQYVLPVGEQVWIGTLIRALGALGYSAEAVRTLISRMQPRIVAQASSDNPLDGLDPERIEGEGVQIVHLPVTPAYSTAALIQTAVRNLG